MWPGTQAKRQEHLATKLERSLYSAWRLSQIANQKYWRALDLKHWNGEVEPV